MILIKVTWNEIASSGLQTVEGRKEGKKENILYLTTHSTHFIYGYMALDIWIKNHSDSEIGNLLQPHRLLFLISSKGSFYMHYPTDRTAHTMAFVTHYVEHWLEQEISQWVHHKGLI